MSSKDEKFMFNRSIFSNLFTYIISYFAFSRIEMIQFYQISSNIRSSIQKLKLQIFNMSSEKTLKYAKISLKRREKLVNLVEQPNMSISRAARMLGLKSSTAKLIVKRYQQDGTFFESKSSMARRLLAQTAKKEAQIQQQILESHRNNRINQSYQNGSLLPTEVPCQATAPVPIFMLPPQNQMFYWIFPQEHQNSV